MFKNLPKQRNSQPKIKGNQTWSPGENHIQNNFFALAKKPPKPITKVSSIGSRDATKEFLQNQQENYVPKLHRRQQSKVQKLDSYQEQQQGLVYYPPHNMNTAPQLKRVSSQQKNLSCNSEIDERFKQIQSIMGIENENLRQQKDYLLRTIYKMQMREKQFKGHLMSYKDKVAQLEQQNRLLRDKYEKARDFIASGIGKMEEVISKSPVEDNSNKNTTHHSNDSSVSVNNQIQELSDKFDAMMYEYQKTRQPQIRKQCIQIAKQLRRLRKSDAGTPYFPISMIKNSTQP